MIHFQYPTFYKDGQAIGSLSQAFTDHPADAKALEIAHAIAWGRNAEDDSRVALDAAMETIVQLKAQLAPAIFEITPALLDAGLLEWGQDAVSAVDQELGREIMGLVIQLKEIAGEPPSWNQCDLIKELFGTIGTMSGVWPSSAQATAMQAVLDAGCPSTGPVSADQLSFQPWI